MDRTLLKVCCIASVEEANLAISAGATAIGLVGEMPSGPGIIDDDTITLIAETVGDRAWTVLLTSRTQGNAICDHVVTTGVNTVQIVDNPEPGTYQLLKALRPTPRIIQVIHVENDSAIEEAKNAAEEVDVILLDSGKPSAATKILGGTGETHNWAISRAIVEAVPCPVFLAGGIRPDNVADAIVQVEPGGIDLCSGVRTNGNLDPELLEGLTEAMGIRPRPS